jgi:hypothetical protein
MRSTLDQLREGATVRRHLTRKNLLIAAVLITVYVVILRWCENHVDPPGTSFTVLAPFCPESAPTPLAFIPLTLMAFVGGAGFLVLVAVRGLFRWILRGQGE